MSPRMNRMLGIALVAQIALLVGVSFAREESKMAPPSKVFDGFVPDKVTKIEITGDSATGTAPMAPKTVTLTKKGTAWGIASADDYPVDQAKVTAMLEAFAKLKASGAVVSKSSYYKKLEVADDDYQRKVVLTADGNALSFFLGTSPGFKKAHLRNAGESDVRLVGDVSIWDVGYRASDWVDKAYAKVAETDVWGLTLENGKGRIQLERSPAGEWAVLGAKPDQTVKKTAVDDLVRKAALVSLEAPIGRTERPEHGLDRPQATITLITGTSTIAGAPPPATQTRVIKVGSKLGEGNAYYVRASTSEYVVTSPGYGIEPLTSKAAADLFEAPAPKK